MTITAARSKELLELCEKATPEPWWYDTYNTIFSGSEQNHNLLEICAIPDEPETGESEPITRDRYYPESSNNAEFIAQARTALPQALKQLEKLIDAARKVTERCPRCGTNRAVTVRNGRSWLETDSPEEVALCFDTLDCPECVGPLKQAIAAYREGM